MRLYNSLSKTIEEFKPIKDNSVSVYVCGITPYDTTHLGHAFTYISFDVLIRYLNYKGFTVNYTQNVTDIDDDILKKADEEKKDWRELGQFWTDKFLNDLKLLNILPPTNYAKVTDSIPKIIEIIRNLVDKNTAYEKEGNIYFDTGKFEKYGNLSKYSKNQMILLSKERGADPFDPLKKNPLDFILWQKTKNNEPFWESPWGKGRPGWHIECSAMIHSYLGERIDIHGGGRDLIFPHHESEIAQSESFTGKSPFVSYWMHISMVLFEGEKMSKSLGNLVMVSELSKKYSANVIRFMLLSNYYRKPWEFDYSQMDEAQLKFNFILEALKKRLNENNPTLYLKDFEIVFENDMNAPRSLDLVYEISLKIINGQEVSQSAQEDIKKILEVLGFDLKII